MDNALDLLDAVAPIVEALAWPVAAIVIALLLTSNSGRTLFESISRRVRRVGAFGVEVELTSDAASRFRIEADEAFAAYRAEIAAEYDREVSVEQINELRRQLVSAVFPSALMVDEKQALLRTTIYVPDPLFTEGLYQLLDYFPGRTRRTRGRVFSMRFGIIGLAWRSQSAQFQPEVSTEPNDLVKEWGMLLEEAEGAGQGRQTFLAVPILHSSVPVGVFYADAAVHHAFSDTAAAEVAAAVGDSDLPNRLDAIGRRLRQRSPALVIFGDSE